jgi:hypothetical protein
MFKKVENPKMDKIITSTHYCYDGLSKNNKPAIRLISADPQKYINVCLWGSIGEPSLNHTFEKPDLIALRDILLECFPLDRPEPPKTEEYRIEPGMNSTHIHDARYNVWERKMISQVSDRKIASFASHEDAVNFMLMKGKQ